MLYFFLFNFISYSIVTSTPLHVFGLFLDLWKQGVFDIFVGRRGYIDMPVEWNGLSKPTFVSFFSILSVSAKLFGLLVTWLLPKSIVCTFVYIISNITKNIPFTDARNFTIGITKFRSTSNLKILIHFEVWFCWK